MHEVREGLLAVDEHDRDPLAVATLQLGVAGDVDLVEIERHLAAHALDHGARALAEMATVGADERDRDRHGRRTRNVTDAEDVYAAIPSPESAECALSLTT